MPIANFGLRKINDATRLELRKEVLLDPAFRVLGSSRVLGPQLRYISVECFRHRKGTDFANAVRPAERFDLVLSLPKIEDVLPVGFIEIVGRTDSLCLEPASPVGLAKNPSTCGPISAVPHRQAAPDRHKQRFLRNSQPQSPRARLESAISNSPRHE